MNVKVISIDFFSNFLMNSFLFSSFSRPFTLVFPYTLDDYYHSDARTDRDRPSLKIPE